MPSKENSFSVPIYMLNQGDYTLEISKDRQEETTTCTIASLSKNAIMFASLFIHPNQTKKKLLFDLESFLCKKRTTSKINLAFHINIHRLVMNIDEDSMISEKANGIGRYILIK